MDAYFTPSLTVSLLVSYLEWRKIKVAGKQMENTKLAPTPLYIKNMVCNRCIKVVKTELEKLGLHPLTVQLGEVTLAESEAEVDWPNVRSTLAGHGFVLLDDKKAWVVEKIKTTIIELIHQPGPTHTPYNFSRLIEEKLGMEYTYLSTLFSSQEGVTIEKYLIRQRIERAKELLAYKELTLSEIAWKLGYSSVAHLSGQFKKVTGMTPSAFKGLKEPTRQPLDEV